MEALSAPKPMKKISNFKNPIKSFLLKKKKYITIVEKLEN